MYHAPSSAQYLSSGPQPWPIFPRTMKRSWGWHCTMYQATAISRLHPTSTGNRGVITNIYNNLWLLDVRCWGTFTIIQLLEIELQFIDMARWFAYQYPHHTPNITILFQYIYIPRYTQYIYICLDTSYISNKYLSISSVSNLQYAFLDHHRSS